ncbi:hypothetical protein BN2475_90169 [Paraburkholderia ribeironis]|uniref:Uncharacterized protein n=1 Tax=Paraburkholderia ribeironis TaxID=1247936 RepID=A0A1N7RNM9_9BURK|nr:hypothetical protein [Paraburkholderia ribeironis]SIT36705.1 hypothetical protein BN2475_90169 [Paraburkholderia ribeironis]
MSSPQWFNGLTGRKHRTIYAGSDHLLVIVAALGLPETKGKVLGAARCVA